MIKLLSLLILLIGCQDINSNSGDKLRYGPLNLVDNDAAFAEAYVVLQVRCASCHQHTAWAGYKSNQAWVDAGLVVPGNSQASSVVNRIINSESGTGANMPPGGGPIPESEFESIKDWVEQLPP
jgi:hypothetical protein